MSGCTGTGSTRRCRSPLTLARPAQGLLVTSATLRDAGAGEPEAEWAAAEARVGAVHLPSPAIRVAVASPFDYAAQTRAFVVTDVDARDLGGAGGGLPGAVPGGGRRRARPVHRDRPAARGARADRARRWRRPAFRCCAQHVDAMDNATLVDIFRTEEDSCLLGTDAMRDGVDVPGRALRLVVFERVPWPRPDILHRERRVHLSGGDPTGYDDRIVRLPAAPGVRAADPQGHRPRRVRAAGPADADAAAVGVSGRSGGAAGRAGGGGGGDAGVFGGHGDGVRGAASAGAAKAPHQDAGYVDAIS